MRTVFSSKTHYIDGKSKTAPKLLAAQLGQLMSYLCTPEVPPVFVCIGSDRVTGDSLGPLVGSKLHYCDEFIFPVYGTLDFPIHALNLKDAMRTVRSSPLMPHSAPDVTSTISPFPPAVYVPDPA